MALYSPAMTGMANLGRFNEYTSFGKLTAGIDGMNNELQKQSVVTATVQYDKRAKHRQRNKGSPWPGRGDVLYPTSGTALFPTDSGFTTILNGLAPRPSSLGRAVSPEEQAAAVAADTRALGLLRNPEIQNNGKFDSLMTAVLSGTAKAVVPPGIKPFELYVYDTPQPGEEMYTLSNSKPNGVHAALVPRRANGIQRPLRRWNIHANAAASGRPIEQAYAGSYGNAQTGLMDERRALRGIGFAGFLAGLRVLAEHGLELAPSNPDDDPNLTIRTGRRGVALDSLAAPGDINLLLDNIHAALGPDTDNVATVTVRQQFYARFDAFLLGSPIEDLFMGMNSELYAARVGSGSDRAERVKFQARAAQDWFVQNDVTLAGWTEQIKIIPLTPGDSNGDATVLIVH